MELFNHLTALLITGLLSIGLVSGFLGGMLGIGGGVVIVPCLILLFEASGLHQTQHVTVTAVATSLACIVFTSLSAAITQIRANKVRWDLVRKLVAYFVCGSFVAGLLIPYLPADVLRLIIGLFLLFVAIVMLGDWKPAPHRDLPPGPGGSAIGLSGGFIAGTAGIAGGNVIVPTLVFFNVPIHNATATSSAMGVVIAAAAALAYALWPSNSDQAVGFVDLASFVLITLGAVVAAPLGVKVAHKVPAAGLKRIFGALLILVSCRMLWSALYI